jgi:Icc-related predicted phosphoesterase
MKFVAISDTHGQHSSLQLPQADCIIHAGDVTRKGKRDQVMDFLYWFGALDYRYKVFIAGNHDFFFENRSRGQINSLIPDNVIYLNDSGCVLEGIKCWGSPVTPWFHDWAFNRLPGEQIRKHWDLIPEGVDILITHGPVKGILDRTFFLKKAGCSDLLKKMNRIRPRVHLCGHIHEAYGERHVDGIHYINASVLNLRYKLANQPVVFEL